MPDEPDAPDERDARDEPDAAIERREFGHVVFVIGPDAASVGRAVREETAKSVRQVLAFVGAADHPAVTEMLAELGAEPIETHGG